MVSHDTLFLFALAIVSSILAFAADVWGVYRNERFGTTIDYPTSRFRPEPPPASDDGRRFTAPDGAEFSVFGSHNVLDHTPSDYEAWLKESDPAAYGRVTYRAKGREWLVLSGIRGEDIFYEKYVFEDDGSVMHGLVVTYPVSLRDVYDPITDRMAKSLRLSGEYDVQ